MIFASSLFLFLFLPLTLAAYFLLATRFRNAFLLAASLVFYAWGEPIYIFLMLASIVFNYGAGLLIHRQRHKPIRYLSEKTLLAAAITGNLGLLFYFKYINFLVENLNCALTAMGEASMQNPAIALPIGISFFTFQAMSYVIDVYRKHAAVERSLIRCGLYVALFPQLIAGPIVRYHDVARQIVSRTISSELFSSGIQRFIFGLAKKVLIANPLGEVADKIFSVPVAEITPGMAWLGIACYTLQIYFDFSGYSDMAIGLGRMFGFEFMENFHYPYISKSIREFWRRWHISLSSWFRDYLYIPLGGSRGSALRTYFNLWVVFFLCGLWHGASWNFAIWGLLHGVWLVLERLGLETYLSRLWQPLQHAYVLLLVMIGWVFFRAETLPQALQYLSSMAGFTEASGAQYYALFYLDLKTVLTLLIGFIAATPLPRRLAKHWYHQYPQSMPWQIAIHSGYYGLLAALFGLAAAYLAAGTYNPFIYYRF
jgi:alginate O-acetyltransferase complex protein AlgI